MIFRITSLLIVLLLTGCSDPVTNYVNKKWPPVTIDQQRQSAIASAAGTLSHLPSPNLAVSVGLKDIRSVIDPKISTIPGIKKADITGDEQLLKIEIQFAKTFTEEDAAGDANAAKLLKELRPEIEGKITAYLGATSGSTAEANHKEIALQLLPVFSSIHVEKIRVAEKVDVTTIGDVIAATLTKYSDNITGEVSRLPAMKVVLPAEIGGAIDPNKTIVLADKSAGGNVKITGSNVTSPVRLHSVAWLIAKDQIRAVGQFIPAGAPNPPEDLKIEPSFGKVKDRFEAIASDSFAMPDDMGNTWAAIRKDLVALSLNSAIGQAAICIQATAETQIQTASNKISFPDADKIDCSPDDDCYSKRRCDDITGNHDTRDCNRCLVESPKICAFGGCVGGGGCVVRGNDPICEAAKAGQNAIYDADTAGRKLDCGRLQLQENTACELKRGGQKALCEGGKVALKALDRTGNFANIDVSTKARTEGLQVCLKQFALEPNLSKVQIALDIQGTASADVWLKFTPLDIVGHLACQLPWTDTKTFSAQLRESSLTLASDISFQHDDKGDRMLFSTQEKTIPMLLKPSPTEYLLTSVNMTLSCAGLNLIKPTLLVLTPFIPQLQGNIDYKLNSQQISVGLPLPSQKLGDSTISASLKDTGKALAVIASVKKP